MLCAQELLAGAELTYTLSVPPEILNPGGEGAQPVMGALLLGQQHRAQALTDEGPVGGAIENALAD